MFPSRGPESLSRVLIEASALGVPIAAMDTGGTRDIIEPDVTGLLSATPDELAHDVRRLRGRRGAAAAPGRGGARQGGACNSTRRAVVARVERLYEDLLRRSRSRPMKVVVAARPSIPLHGYGGLERHVYDLVRALAARDVLRDAHDAAAARPVRPRCARGDPSDASRVEFVPYRTFPFAGRRGTTVLDRSTAYPLFGVAAGRPRSGRWPPPAQADIVHGLGASVLGYARRATAPCAGAARAEPAGARGIRRDAIRRARG